MNKNGQKCRYINMCMYIYIIYTHTHTDTHTHIYVYIYTLMSPEKDEARICGYTRSQFIQ